VENSLFSSGYGNRSRTDIIGSHNLP